MTYATWCGGGNIAGPITFNFKSETAMYRLKHILFHEFTHVLVSPIRVHQDLGKYKKIVSHDNSKNMHVISNTMEYEPIIHMQFGSFLDEIIAESTACDLLDDYKSKRVKVDNSGITSDWLTEYNMRYQELGYEFLRTIFPYSDGQTDRNLFKELTLKALDNDKVKNIGKEIQDAYMKKNSTTWKEDLRQITSYLESLMNNFADRRAQINRAKILMEKYKCTPIEKPRFKTTKRTNSPKDNNSRFKTISRDDR